MRTVQLIGSLFLLALPINFRARHPVAIESFPEAINVQAESDQNDEIAELQHLASEMRKARSEALAKARDIVRREIQQASGTDYPKRGHEMKLTTMDAITILGLARDGESISILVDAIDFVAPVWLRESPNRALSVGDEPPNYRLYPARASLVIIGAPAARPLVLALAREVGDTSRSIRRRYFLQSTLAAIAGPEGAVRLFEQAIELEVRDSVRDQLVSAKEAFKKQARVGQVCESMDYQLFEGSIQEYFDERSRGEPENRHGSSGP